MFSLYQFLVLIDKKTFGLWGEGDFSIIILLGAFVQRPRTLGFQPGYRGFESRTRYSIFPMGEGQPITTYIKADEHPEALHLKIPRKFSPHTTAAFMHIAASHAVNFALSRLHIAPDRPQRSYEDWMGFVNGQDTRELANKNRFVEITQALGFNRTLKQIVLAPGMDLEQMRQALQTDFPNPDELVLRKGLGQGLGKGVVEYPVGELRELLPHLVKIRSEIAVQKIVPVERTFRAIFMDEPQTPNHPDQRNVIEHYFELHMPEVVGTGNTTLRELIKTSGLPKKSKRKLLHSKKLQLDGIPPENEKVILSHVAHSTHGGYYSTPDSQTAERLREYAIELRSALEKKYGHRIPVFAVDFGVQHADILSGPLTLEQMQSDIVAFEQQMPFDPGFDNKKNPTFNSPRWHLLMMKLRYKGGVQANR